MDNRERDKVSRNNSSPTDAGEVNRKTSEREGRQKNDSDANFGQNIGRSENPENEPSRRGSSDDSSYSESSIERSSGRGMRGSSSGSEH